MTNQIAKEAQLRRELFIKFKSIVRLVGGPIAFQERE
jgi:hypothetical protein